MSIMLGVLGVVVALILLGVVVVVAASFTEQWLETKDHAPALIGLGVSIVCRLLFGADSFLLPTMGGMLCCLLVLDARRTKKGGESV